MKKILMMMALAAMTMAVSAQQKWAYQSDYDEGRACVKDANGKWGHIDEQGKLVGQMWRNVKYFQEGLAPVENQDEFWGFVDKTGKVVIPCIYFNVGWFSEGLSAVALSEDYSIKYGYIDKTGKVVIPLQWEEAYSFKNGKAKVQVKQDDGQRVWKIIDKTGKYVE